MGRSRIVVGIIGFLIGVGLTISVNHFYLGNDKQANSSVQNTSSSSPEPCGIDNRYQETAGPSDEELSRTLLGNEIAIKYVKDNCMWVFGAVKAKLTGSETEDLVFWGAKAVCGSCHGQTVYVVSGDKIIHQQGADDPKVEIAKNETGKNQLVIIEPLRSLMESLSNPSWGIKTTYDYFEGKFMAIDRVPYEYK
jgi:hypothetical protein